MRARKAITKDAIPGLLESLGSPWGPHVQLDLTPWKAPDGEVQPDYRVRLRWPDQEHDFVAEGRSRSTPRTVDQAVQQARRHADATGLLPMIIVPYLEEGRLDRLAEEGVSGLDLSGNGILIVPGRLLLRRSGQPNRHPESQPTKHAYRGATSLVPRVFLCRPEYARVGAIKDEIEARGGSVALSTVSKALARMAEDLLIERTDSRIALLRPDALLDRLRDSFRMPSCRRTVRVRTAGPLAALFKRANDEPHPPRLVLSGASSRNQYGAGIRFDELVAYCDDLSEIRRRVGDGWKETQHSADLTVVELSDRTAFFDARRDSTGVTYASPLQAYLELASGGTQDRQRAVEIRESALCPERPGRAAGQAATKTSPSLRRRTITLTDLRARRDEILDLAAQHGATNVRVFGSVARGEAGPDSDVDLLVEIARDRSLLDHIALIQDLRDLLHHGVDVVSDCGLNPRVRGRVLEEAVSL